MKNGTNRDNHHSLTPTGALFGSALLRHGVPEDLQILSIGIEQGAPWIGWTPGTPMEMQDILTTDFQLALAFLGKDDGESVESLIITLGELHTDVKWPPIDGPPKWQV